MRLLNKCNWEYLRGLGVMAVNPYQGECPHRCCWDGVSCWTERIRAYGNPRHNGKARPVHNFRNLLVNELEGIEDPGIVLLSNMQDAYQPLEEDEELTRFAVRELLHRDWTVIILTKSSLVERDFDIFNDNVWLGMTLTSPEWAWNYEKASSFIERTATLQFNEPYGFNVWESWEPFDPRLSVSNVGRVLEATRPEFVVFGSLNKNGRPVYDYSKIVPELWELTKSYSIPFYFKSEILSQVPEKLRLEIQAENKVPWRK